VKKSPLQLDAYYFAKVNVEVNPQFKQTKDMTKSGTMPVVDIQFAQANNAGHKWQVSVTAKNAPDTIAADPCIYTIQAVGFVTVDPSVPDDKMMKLVAVNAPALIYPAIREMLQSIASRGPFPGRHLPSVMFTDLQLTKAEAPAPTNRIAAQRKQAHAKE